MQIAGKVAEVSGTNSKHGLWKVLWQNGRSRQASGLFWSWLMRFRKVPVQMADEVPDGSSANSRQSW